MESAYKITFTKKDGTLRTMLFCEVKDLPKQLISDRIKNNGVNRVLQDGNRVVYDLEARDFRIINEKTMIGQIETISLDSVFEGGYNF